MCCRIHSASAAAMCPWHSAGPDVIPSVARDLGGWGTKSSSMGAPPAQVPRYARDDRRDRHCRIRALMVRVPIHGIGVIAPDAIGVEALCALLASGASAVREIDGFDTTGLSAHTAALVRDFKARDVIAPMKMRRMNALSRFAVAAAKLAIEDCGAALPS